MEMKKAAIAVLILAVMILASAQPALSRGCQDPVTDPGVIVVDKSAPGTKLSGPLTIYYELLSEELGINGPAKLYFFLRLKKGYNIYPFAGTAEIDCYGNIYEIQAAIDEFIGDTVVPALFPNTPDAPYALKSVDKMVEPDTEGVPDGDTCCGDLLFTILDVVIAVEE